MPPAQQIRRGFPNLRTVRRSLKLLIPRIRSGRLPAPPTEPWKGWLEYDPRDAVVSVQRVARSIAEVYHLDVGLITVTFVNELGSAGRVELHGGRDFFVELDASLRTSSRDLAATLGHEVAHIFLEKHGLRFATIDETEILTDTTAAMYGFGVLMADTYTVTKTYRPVAGGTEITTKTRGMGYLSPDEFAYVVTRSGTAGAFERLTSKAAKGAFRKGRAG